MPQALQMLWEALSTLALPSLSASPCVWGWLPVLCHESRWLVPGGSAFNLVHNWLPTVILPGLLRWENQVACPTVSVSVHCSINAKSCLTLFSSVQLLSCVQLFVTPWIAPHQASLSITNCQSLLKLMPIKLVLPSNQLILCRPLFLLPPIPPRIRVFSNESTLRIRWPKCWSFSFSINPSNEHTGLISFRMDWLDLLAVQGTLKSLFQHHSSKASIFRHSGFFTVQLSHPYMTTGKTIALTRQTFVG